jgi:hypothetical protein
MITAPLPGPTPVTNRAAISSLIYATLTLVSFCVGIAPLPFTSLVCYPASLVLACLAVVSGFTGLQQIRREGGSGRGLAWTGIWLGGLTIAAVLCIGTLAALFYPRALEFLLHNWSRIH